MLDGGKPRSVQNVVGIALGGIGTVLCIAALVLIWIINAWLLRVTSSLVDRLEDSLVAVRERVVQIHDRVQSAKVATDDTEKSIRVWTKREAGERVALRLNVAEKVDRAAAIVQQASDWLEIAESSAALVNSVVSSIDSTSDQVDPSSLDQFIKEIASIHAQLAEAMQVIASIRERLAAASEDRLPSEKIEQAVQLAVRLGTTFGNVESRLQKTNDRLSDAQDRIEEAKTKTRRRIYVVTIGVTLLILLMAAGQIALCRLAWNGFGKPRHRTEIRPSPT